MQIRIASDDGVPIYIQIVNQVKHLVASGRLVPGTKSLPSASWPNNSQSTPIPWRGPTSNSNTRALSPNGNGTGTYVSEVRAPMLQREKIKILSCRADALLTEARQLDVDLAEVIKLLRERDALMPNEEIQK